MSILRAAVQTVWFFGLAVFAMWGAMFVVLHTRHDFISSVCAYLFAVGCACFFGQMLAKSLGAYIMFRERWTMRRAAVGRTYWAGR